MVKIIFGLGNPGKKYLNTRHNLGFWVLDALAEKYNINISKKSCQSLWGGGCILSKKIILVKPLTFMNLSGIAVNGCLVKFHAEKSEIIVVCDDINLSQGKIRIRKDGSSGGHNGLKSIIDELSSQDFSRLRIGAGQPPEAIDGAEFVTKAFSRSESKFFKATAQNCVEILEDVIENGMDSAMNKYN